MLILSKNGAKWHEDAENHTLSIRVVGVPFKYKDTELTAVHLALQATNIVEQPHQIILKPENDNEHDVHSVLVVLQTDAGTKHTPKQVNQVLGWVPREINQDLRSSLHRLLPGKISSIVKNRKHLTTMITIPYKPIEAGPEGMDVAIRAANIEL